MNVLFIVAQDYPDMEQVKDRLRKGAETEHKTFRRKGDRVVKGLAEELELDIPEYIGQFDYTQTGEAYASEAMSWFDAIIVYTTDKSTVTKFYVKKATEWPYSIMYGAKTDITEAKSIVTRKRKAARRAE